MSTKRKTSINDIAKALHVSKTTISFILNGKAKEKRISEDLTKKVLDYVEANNFKPNQLAKSLSTGKTQTIGLLIENISDYFFAEIAYHIEGLAYENGYKIIYASTNNDTVKAKELISLFKERHVDGFIITAPVGIEEDIKDLINNNYPLVLLDRYFKGVDTSYVVIDNFDSTYNAVKFLIEKKYSNITYIDLDSDQSQMLDRRQGYLKAIEEGGLKSQVVRIPYSNEKEQTVALLHSLLKTKKNIDALFFSTNYLAMSGIKAINQLGLHIPDDIAIIAFDDHFVFDMYNPTITAVAQPLRELAFQLITTLLEKLENKEVDKKIVVPAHFIIRNSTR